MFLLRLLKNRIKNDAMKNTLLILKQEYLNPQANLNKTLFSFLDKDYLEKDFADFVNRKKGNRVLKPYDYFNFYYVPASIFQLTFSGCSSGLILNTGTFE